MLSSYELTTGSVNWDNVKGAAIGGAATGLTLLYTGNPFIAGGVGGAVSNVAKAGFNGQSVDPKSLFLDTTIGAATGFIPAFIPGRQVDAILAGRFSTNLASPGLLPAVELTPHAARMLAREALRSGAVVEGTAASALFSRPLSALSNAFVDSQDLNNPCR